MNIKSSSNANQHLAVGSHLLVKVVACTISLIKEMVVNQGDRKPRYEIHIRWLCPSLRGQNPLLFRTNTDGLVTALKHNIVLLNPIHDIKVRNSLKLLGVVRDQSQAFIHRMSCDE